MSKHETSNQFNNGLMMDVHPLQTPNTVLTDCLNGTFITYNGNEHVLQNDMGNYKLEKCKLKENYIPIGTASYGDILYIASYNPIDKKFELGSYPSPLQWNALSNDDTRSLYSAIDNFVNDSSSEDKRLSWLGMTKFTQTEVFDNPKFKLQPGDEYLLDVTGDSEYRMEKLNYYIMDDNSVKHKVQVNINEKKPVSWETPGYLCVEHSVMTPFEHNLSLRKAIVGNNAVTYSLRSVLTVQDEELCEILDKGEVHKSFIFEITALDKKIKVYYDLENKTATVADEECVEFKFDSVAVYPWLNERKQIIFDYTIVLQYTGEYELATKKDEAIIYNNVPTTIVVLPTFLDNNGITILYDNLQQFLSYSASGDNVSSAATKYFTWNRTSKNNSYVWTISWDVFVANDRDKIEYALFDFNGNSICSGTCNADTNVDIPTNYDNQLICLIIIITKESGEVIKTGRFAFLDTSETIVFTAATRMDVIYNIQDVFNNLCKGIKTTINFSEPVTDGKLVFNNSLFDVVPDKHTVWFDNRLDEDILNYQQTWMCDLTVKIDNEFEGVWKNLNIVSQLSNDKKTTFGAKWKCVKTQSFSPSVELNGYAYIPIDDEHIIDWGDLRELAWDQTDTYDATMRIHVGKTKSKYKQEFNNADWKKGTDYKLWNNWLVKKEDWLFKSIYAYKYKDGGNYYYISNIGSARDKGRAGIDGSHIAGYAYGTTTPEIIMTQHLDYPIRNNLTYVDINPANKLPYWKLRYLYSIDISGHTPTFSQNEIFIRHKGESNSNDTLAWLFNTDKNKLYEKYPDVEFDSLSKMEWLTTQWTEFVKIDVDRTDFVKELTMENSKWNTVVDSVKENIKKYKSIYDNMTNLAVNYSMIPVNCMHWFSKKSDDTLSSDMFPIYCIYNNDFKKVSFNVELAKKLGAEKCKQLQAYFKVNYSGTIKTNLGPLKIIKYGF